MLTSSLINLEGKPVGFQHIARDITEEIKMRDNLRFYLGQVTQAQEEERKRIARELHDDTAQSLFAVSRQIDNFMRDMVDLSDTQIAFLQQIRIGIGETLQGVRQFSQDLRPPIIDDLGLLPAIQWLVKQMQDGHNVVTDLIVLGNRRRFAPEVESTVFRVVQEALRNVSKHAYATKVEVVFQFKKASFNIKISDNGKGFQLPENVGDLSRKGKLGLVGMQERVRSHLLPNLLSGDKCPDGHHGTSERLAQAHYIGDNTVMFYPKQLASPAHASLHLISNKKNTIVVTNLTNLWEIIVGWNNYSSLALDWLQNHRRNILPNISSTDYFFFQGISITIRNMPKARY